MNNEKRAKELLAEMTLEEKVSLCSGKSAWFLKSVERLGLNGIMVTDGPHGLRKQRPGEDTSLNDSVPATCFPTACATACSFDRGLLFEIGAAIADECRQEGVSVLLGPGTNLKRSPLCGRNFEYFSEDPMLAGELAAAFIKGVQSRGVGTSLKHFAANDQETRRLTVDAVVDERTLRELYLAAFERAVKQAQPWTVMCSYNKLNGEYASENKRLLTDILREEWGFAGLVVSDWGAVNDRVKALEAGLDLEMPGGDNWNDRALLAAVREGRLSEAVVDRAAARVIELILNAQAAGAAEPYDAEVHHALAHRAAIASSVLVKNDGLLPSSIFKTAAVIGAFAAAPRYQGSGSSRITPTMLDRAVREFTKAGLNFDYAPGYGLNDAEPDERLIREACETARGKDIVYLFAGLPDSFESEGFDRESLAMPRAQTELIRRVAEVNPNVAVILSCGSVVDLSWESSARAILISYLGGQAGAGAAVDILLGRVSPCGKLAESWPFRLEDLPSSANFPGSGKRVEYREGLFVGYRWFDAAGLPPRYPFGYGLSYTSFALSDLKLSDRKAADNGEITVSCRVTNTGSMPGAEIVQLYIASKNEKLFHPVRELKGFEKVRLNPGETKEVWFKIGGRDFAWYSPKAARWCVESGEYEIGLGVSSRDIRLKDTVEIFSASHSGEDQRETLPDFFTPETGRFLSDRAFEALLGRPLPPEEDAGGPFTVNSTVGELLACEEGRRLLAPYMKDGKLAGDNDLTHMFEKAFLDMPLRAIGMIDPETFGRSRLDALLERLNAARA